MLAYRVACIVGCVLHNWRTKASGENPVQWEHWCAFWKLNWNVHCEVPGDRELKHDWAEWKHYKTWFTGSSGVNLPTFSKKINRLFFLEQISCFKESIAVSLLHISDSKDNEVSGTHQGDRIILATSSLSSWKWAAGQKATWSSSWWGRQGKVWALPKGAARRR